MHCPAARMPPPLRATVACLMLLVKGVLETIYCSKQTKGVSLAVSFPFFFFFFTGEVKHAEACVSVAMLMLAGLSANTLSEIEFLKPALISRFLRLELLSPLQGLPRLILS